MREDWKKYSLEKLASYNNGKAFKPSDWQEDGIKIIRIEQLNNPVGHYDYYKGKVSEINRIVDSDLLFSWSATLKVLIWQHGEAVLNQHLFKVIPKEFIDKKFLFYLLDYNMEKLGEMSHGSTMKHIKKGELQKFFVLIPDKLGQQKIAHILGTLDSVITRTEAVIAKYTALKAGLLQDLFTRGIDANGNLRPSPQEAPDLYKESALGLIPKEWEIENLSALATIIYGADYKNNPPGDNVPIIGTGGIIGYTGIALNEGPAVLTGRKGSINRPVYVEGPFWNVDTIFCLIPKPKVDAKWLYYNLLNTNLELLNEATGVPSVSANALYSLRFCRYAYEVQQELVKRLDQADINIQTEQTYLTKLQGIRVGLMADLLSGRVDVSGYVDDPAVVENVPETVVA